MSSSKNGKQDTPEMKGTPKPKIKHDWYQTETHVIITILMKNTEKDKIKIDYGEKHLSFSSPIPNSESEYSLELDLSHPIVPEQCTFTNTPSKVEIKLKKRDGLRWTGLECELGANDIDVKPIPQAVVDASGPQTIKSPYTSARPKDWNKIEKEIEKQEENEKPEGDAALKKLFEQIYGQGSDEVKKAMVKSYMESGGTVLSTNWNEVSKETVAVKPPDGLEYKKWDS